MIANVAFTNVYNIIVMTVKKILLEEIGIEIEEENKILSK